MSDYNSRLGDYVDVAARIAEFRTKYPEGSLQPADPAQPYRIETIADRTFIVVIAAAYRTADDHRPGIGMAYEPWPGRTPYTKDSELMNAETSAWGRAIVAVLAADTKRGVASADEVHNRQVERDHVPSYDPGEQEMLRDGYEAEIDAAKSGDEITEIGTRVRAKRRSGDLSPATYQHLADAAAKRRAELDTIAKSNADFAAAQASGQEPATVPPAADIPPTTDTRPPPRRNAQLAGLDRRLEQKKAADAAG